MIKGSRWVHKRILNRLKKWYLVSRETKLEEPMMMLYDLFDVPKPEKKLYQKKK